MSKLRDAFDERLDEVHAYMDFLSSMEARAQTGAPRFDGADTIITPQQQKLLYAGVYLQLYNLIEATVTLCVESVAEAVYRETPHDLSDSLRREWVRTTARTHIDLSYPHRLDAAVEVADQLLGAHPIGSAFKIEKGAGGNWDDDAIEKISHRLGCQLKVSKSVYALIKRRFKDDMGPLTLVRSRRNSLAHGAMSFTESAEEVTVSELGELVGAIIDYLSEVVDQFDAFVSGHGYLRAHRRPAVSS